MPNPHNAFVPRRRYEIVSYQWQYKFGCHRQNGRGHNVMKYQFNKEGTATKSI